jgi:hypothetical protein
MPSSLPFRTRLVALVSMLALSGLTGCSAELEGDFDAPEVSQSDDALVGQDELELGRGLPRADFSGPLPASASTTDFSRWNSPVKGQGSRGWCTAFATVAGIENLANRHLGADADLSEIDHYQSYRRYEMATSVSTASRTPIAPESAWPYYGNPVPDYRQNRHAKVLSYAAPETRAEVLEELAKGHPLVMGITTFKNFDADASGRVPLPQGRKRGGHAVAVTGFVRDASYAGGGYLVFKNSWGTAFGDKGYGHLPLDYCSVSTCYFIAIRSIEYAGRTTPEGASGASPLPPVQSPEPTPAPSPPAPSTGSIVVDDTTVRAVAQHDPATPSRFRLALQTSPEILTKIASVRYDVDASFGQGRYATSSDRASSFRTSTVYRTYDDDWRTNGAELTLVDGRKVPIAGAVIRF